MPDFTRLFGAAARALGDSSSPSSPQGSPQRGQRSGSTDWRDLVRTAADTLTGDGRDQGQGEGHHGQGQGRDQGRVDHGQGQQARGGQQQQSRGQRPDAPSHDDAVALAKYDYLVRTARPDQLEQVHRDAFERLSPAQREQLRARLGDELPAHERPRGDGSDELARAATRGETAHPGLLQRVLGGRGGAQGSERQGSGRPGSGRAGAAAAGAAAGLGVGALGGLAVAVAGAAALSATAAPLLGDALASGVDFDGLAEGFGVDGLAEGVQGLGGGVEGLAQSGEEHLTGFGEQVGDLGQGFQIPGLGDLFDR